MEGIIIGTELYDIHYNIFNYDEEGKTEIMKMNPINTRRIKIDNKYNMFNLKSKYAVSKKIDILFRGDRI